MATQPTEWVDFTKKDWQRMVDLRGLFNCLRISSNADEDKWSIYPSFGFPVERNDGFVAGSINPSADVMTYSTYDKTVNSYHEQGYDVTSANMGVPGIASGSITTKEEHSHEETFEATEVYVTSVYKVPKVRIALNQDKIELHPDFIHAVEEALHGGDINFQDMHLQEILREFGHYVVTELQLGGLLRGSSSKTVTSHSEAEEFSTSVKASFEADLAAFDVPISGGASYEHGDSHGSKHSETHERVKLEITAIGGDPSKIEKYSEWAASLAPYEEWHVIRTGGLVPVINFLPDELLAQVGKVISRVEGYSDYIKKSGLAGSSVLDD